MNRSARLLSHGVAALLLSSGLSLADGDGGGGGGDKWRNSKLQPVQEVITLGDYTTALEKLSVLYEKDPNDADVLNLRGYSYRQMGDFDNALRNYQAALKLKPKHRGANEYLGELYLQTGQLAKAEERLAVLDDACFFGCKQYYDLKKAIQAYKQENGTK